MAEVVVRLQNLVGSLSSGNITLYPNRGNNKVKHCYDTLMVLLPKLSEAVACAVEKQASSTGAVESWIQDLMNVLYDLENLFDDIVLQQLVKEASTRSMPLSNWCNLRFPAPFSPKSQLLGKLSTSVSKLERIARSVESSGGLSTDGGVSSYIQPRPLKSVHGFPFLGRDEDKKNLISLLREGDDAADHGVPVICMVGKVGIGKTTLAQLVYQNQAVKEQFDRIAWFHVEEDFNISIIMKLIIQEGSSEVSDSAPIRTKKFLLVLDNLQDMLPTWGELLTQLRTRTRGSKILVTTSNKTLPSMISNSITYTLAPISSKATYLTLMYHAFGGDDYSAADPELLDLGERIAQKCLGFPLEGQTMGRLLGSRASVKEWHNILDSHVWDSAGPGLIPSLKLCYDHLPTHLKACFAYCSIFPKGYPFRREELIHLWMAESFLVNNRGEKVLEDAGVDFIDDLVSLSFFQPIYNSHFVIPGLLHEIALFVKNGFKSHSKSSRARQYLGSKYDDLEKWESLSVGSLRTLILMSRSLSDFKHLEAQIAYVLQNLMKKQTYLRVLSACYLFHVQLPGTIGNLKHLCYLDVSQSDIRTLPDSVCSLYNLQTLNLSYCTHLKVLPKDIYKLVKLRHLYLTGTYLQKMPEKIGRLTSLLTLTDFVAANGGSSIGELKELINLGGTLCVSKLENVKDGKEAAEGNLKQKINLYGLELEWSDGSHTSLDQAFSILQNLQPARNLKELVICNYGGEKFPQWVGNPLSSNSLVSLMLWSCKRCPGLPPLGLLPSLKSLSVEGTAVVCVGEEFYGRGTNVIPFPSLEILRFGKMSRWKVWNSVGRGEFPRLRELCIYDCPYLKPSLPTNLVSLVILDIYDCPGLENLDVSGYPNLKQGSMAEPLLLEESPKYFGRGREQHEYHGPGKGSEVSEAPLQGHLPCEKIEFEIPNEVASQSHAIDTIEIPVASHSSPHQFFENRSSQGEAQQVEISEISWLSTSKSLEASETSEFIECSPGKRVQGSVAIKSLSRQIIDRGPSVEDSHLEQGELWLSASRNFRGSDSTLMENVEFEDNVALELDNDPSPQVVQNSRARQVELQEHVEAEDNVALTSLSIRMSDNNPSLQGVQDVEVEDNAGLDPLSKKMMDTSLTVSDISQLKELPHGLQSVKVEGAALDFLYSKMIDGSSGSHPLDVKSDMNQGETQHGFSSSSGSFRVIDTSQLMNLPHGLQRLNIEECPDLESISIEMMSFNYGVQDIFIADCCSLKSFPGCAELTELKNLEIRNCRKLEFLPLARQYTALEHVCIWSSCDSLLFFPLNIFPKLKVLCLWDCINLESLMILEGFHKVLEDLDALDFRDCSNLVTFPKEGLLAPNLTSISLSNCKNLKSLPRQMHTLVSLRSLCISNCSELEPPVPGSFPRNLNLICIVSCEKLTPCVEWGLCKLESLRRLEIEDCCEELESFPVEGLLPESLNSLCISKLPNLKSLDQKGFQKLSELETLQIKFCEKLSSLPEDGLPSSLSYLSIKECPLLKPKFRKKNGTYRSMVKHIPYAQIDEEVIS